MPQQIKVSLLSLMIFAVLAFHGAPISWAVYAPEPKSGGRFFESKGTKSAADYQYLGRPGERVYDDYYDYYRGKGLQLEMLKLRPYLGYTGEWDTNIFLEEDDPNQDYISRLNWGAEAEIPMEDGKYNVFGGIHSESEWFAENNQENHTDWIYQLGTTLNFNSFSLEVFEDLRRTVNRAGSELTGREDRWENYIMGLLTIPMGEIFSETEVSHYLLNFRDDAREAFDRDEFRVIPRIGWNAGDRTQVLVEYGITDIDYKELDDRNGMSHALSLGARGFLGQGDLVSYQAWGGWEIRNYNSDMREDFSGFIFRGDLAYRYSEQSKFFLETSRRPEESVSETNSFISKNDIAARWRRQLTESLGGEVRGAMGFYDYSSGRFDFYWEPGAKIDYLLPGRFRFAHLFTEYKFTARHSDAANADYFRHRWNFGVRAEI